MTHRCNIQNQLLQNIDAYLKQHSLANRGIEDGDYIKQRIGLIGELTVYHYLFDVYPDLNEKRDGFDGGYDFAYRGFLVDVKCMGRKSYVQPEFVNNFYLLQAAHKADTIIFCSYHLFHNILEICGWLPKSQLAVKGVYYSAGTKRVRKDGSFFIFRQDNYEVENRHLNDIDLLKNIEKTEAENFM